VGRSTDGKFVEMIRDRRSPVVHPRCKFHPEFPGPEAASAPHPLFCRFVDAAPPPSPIWPNRARTGAESMALQIETIAD